MFQTRAKSAFHRGVTRGAEALPAKQGRDTAPAQTLPVINVQHPEQLIKKTKQQS